MVDGLKNRRVLVVEDDFFIASHIGSVIGGLGAQVVGPAGSLADGLRYARSEDLHGAVVDFDLRGESSLGITKELAGRGIPVIITSGYEQAHMPTEFERLPLVTKPIDEAKLQALAIQLFGS